MARRRNQTEETPTETPEEIEMTVTEETSKRTRTTVDVEAILENFEEFEFADEIPKKHFDREARDPKVVQLIEGLQRKVLEGWPTNADGEYRSLKLPVPTTYATGINTSDALLMATIREGIVYVTPCTQEDKDKMAVTRESRVSKRAATLAAKQAGDSE